MLKVPVFWDVCVVSTDKSVTICQSTWHNIPEDLNFQGQSYIRIKSIVVYQVVFQCAIGKAGLTRIVVQLLQSPEVLYNRTGRLLSKVSLFKFNLKRFHTPFTFRHPVTCADSTKQQAFKLIWSRA